MFLYRLIAFVVLGDRTVHEHCSVCTFGCCIPSAAQETNSTVFTGGSGAGRSALHLVLLLPGYRFPQEGAISALIVVVEERAFA